MFTPHIFSAREIFTTSADIYSQKFGSFRAGLPSFCNLKISKRPDGDPPAIAGCGLYFFLHKGQLVYIGKFLGSIHDAFGGDIFSARWNRHISTLSLRGSRISIGKNTLEKAMQEGMPEDLENALRGVDKDTLAKDRGFMVPYKRLKYAALHWQDFSQEPEAWLDDIKVGYLQLDPAMAKQHAIQALRKKVSAAEAHAIARIPTVLNGPGDFDLSLLKTLSEDDVFKQLGSMFDLPSNEPVDQDEQELAVSFEAASQDEEQKPAAAAELESDFYGERFLESLPSDCPEQTVQALYDAFGEMSFEEVHHTKTNGGDLRIRASKGQESRNIFTMYWQPKNQVFLCRILLAPEDVVGAGIVTSHASTSPEPLPATFKFDCMQSGAKANLVELIDLAITKYRDDIDISDCPDRFADLRDPQVVRFLKQMKRDDPKSYYRLGSWDE